MGFFCKALDFFYEIRLPIFGLQLSVILYFGRMTRNTLVPLCLVP